MPIIFFPIVSAEIVQSKRTLPNINSEIPAVHNA
jgi:hypothetical protein